MSRLFTTLAVAAIFIVINGCHDQYRFDNSVLFYKNDTALAPRVQADLAEFARKYIDRNATMSFEVIGHASPEEINVENLALERAQQVKKYLVSRGVPESRLHTLSKGSDEPLPDSTNSTLNQRVELEPF